jgi:hemerythrin-like domain-containing protein
MSNDAAPVSPFAMLRSSHRRLEERLANLEEAARSIGDPARVADAIAECESVLAFFGRGVARHEEDEERSLFPRLAHISELSPVIAALNAEHEEQRLLVGDLGAIVESLTYDPDPRALLSLTESLRASYVRHLAREENELFPAAEKLLSPDDLADMIREMDARRGRGPGGGSGGGGGGGGGGRRRGGESA